MMELYYIPGGPPSRAVLLLIESLKLKVNLKFVNLAKGEHLTPEFLKINPLHTVPVLVDNDTVICESRVIMAYLCNKYGKDDFLYPKDPKKQAIVNQRLYFDFGTLYASFVDYYFAPIFTKTAYDESKMSKIQDAFKLLDTFLENSKYVSGNFMSIADFAILVSVCSYRAIKFDTSSFKNVNRWLNDLKIYSDIDNEQNVKFKNWYESMAKNM